jgi:uncharacterized protein YoxC
MFKNIIRLIITSLLTIFLISSNAFAFHKENAKTENQKTEWDGSKESKKNYENKHKQKYCALDSKALTSKGDPVIDQNTGLQTVDENGKKVFEPDTHKIRVSGYHAETANKTGGKLLPTLQSLNFNAQWGKLKLVDLLKMYCLQDKTKDRPINFKDSYLEDFYKQVAVDNGFLKASGEEGDYNKNVLEGPLGSDIFKNENGIIIKDPNAVWYVPDFLIKQNKKNVAKIKSDKKKQERKKATKKGNDQWISENKQNYLDKFNKKIDKYESVITKLKTKRNKLINRYKEYEELDKKAKEDIEIAFDDLANIGNQEIKDLKRLIRDDKKSFLSGIEITEYKERLKTIEKINFKKYKNYTSLKNLIKRADKSNKVENFIGTDATKILGITFKQSKIGYIQEFNNIKNRDLGSGSEVDKKNIDQLIYDIDNQIKNINLFIIKPVQELVALDDELGKRIPWLKYIIYFVIFLVLVGIIVVVLIQQRKMKDLRAEANEKVGSLKSDLEGKFRDTSEQIRSVNRITDRAQQSGITTPLESVQEIPKTPEEIISSKYDELVSEYKEALEDFSKVAAFKQKWQGLALSRKERQDGTKTILVSSTRAFEKAEIWCLTFSDKYFAFPGSSVKSNMATYMNLDFEKASRDFKGVFAISSGSTYSTEPSVLRRGGVGFVVERVGTISFPN